MAVVGGHWSKSDRGVGYGAGGAVYDERALGGRMGVILDGRHLFVRGLGWVVWRKM